VKTLHSLFRAGDAHTVLCRKQTVTNTPLSLVYRVAQKKIAQSLMHCHCAIVCSRIMYFSPKCSEINW